jgi:Ca-activated chloride channel family protein
MDTYGSRVFVIGVVALLLFVLPGMTYAIKISPRVDIDRPVIKAGEKETVYIVVQFDVPKIEIDRIDSRPDLNLGLVIDRSGSMEDRGKMDYAKKAAMLVVDKMSPRDHLAVVEYDDEITVLWPSSPVTSPERIKSRISSLFPRNSTNLAGGMMRGVDEVLESMLDRGINRVLLLSDGLANRGVTKPREIKKLVRETRRDGVTITTMGLGLEYNEDLMQMIAEHGGGNYYFIENPNQMHSIYERELGIMFATVAKNVSSRIRFSRNVKDYQVYGYVSDRKGDDVVVDLGDLYSGERLSMVLRLELEPEAEGEISLGTIEFNYIDVDDNTSKNITSDIMVAASNDIDLVNNSLNREVAVEAALVEADDYHEQQIRLYEQGNMEEAVANLSRLYSEIDEKNATLGDVQLDKKLEALKMESERMEEAEEDVTYRMNYLKSSKAQFYASKQGKRGSYLLQNGDSGYEVERLQKTLNENGFYAGPIDGEFSSELEKAITAYQKANGLTADGVAGPKTLQKLGLY